MDDRLPRMTGKLFGIGVALCLALAAFGCAQPTQNAEQQDPARLYKNEVNAAAADLELHLQTFNEAVQAGNVLTMRAEADSAFKSIDQLTKITAPDNYSEVQQDYVNGCNDLKDALDSYLTIYTAMENATEEHPFDYASYEEQLKTIQDQYNSGVEALQAGDQKASSL